MGYTRQDIIEAYRAVGVKRGGVVLLKTDLRYLGPYAGQDQRQALAAHYDALAELIDFSQGTLVVSTGTMSLCNTDTPFDPERTPSEMGSLTEYVRRQPGAVRSPHPFRSFAAVGRQADFICREVARHAYGPETPKDRLLQVDALYLSLGQVPRLTCSLVHHVEMVMGVPYRYSKEFMHPVVTAEGVVREPFYLYVWYRNLDFKRDGNQKIFRHFHDSGYRVAEAGLGRGKVYGYSMREFYRSCLDLFKRDIYCWLAEPPADRPYQI